MGDNMNYDIYFPVSVLEQKAFIEKYVLTHSISDCIWISKNRDFGEQERYKEKDEVDDSLINSENVSNELEKIRVLFENEDQFSSAIEYDELLKAELKELTDIYISGIKMENADISDIQELWDRIKVLSDIDNAHAMYLSSDNWPFSVFHKIIDNISDAINSDFEILNDLLTAGMQDVRTSIFYDYSGKYQNCSREDYISSLISEKNFIRENGVLPFFTFIAETGKKVDVISPEVIRKSYNDAKEKALRSVSEENAEKLINNLKAYELLYADRVTYDIYEYYGFYSFVRNALVLKTGNILRENIGNDIAERFMYLASTYQFDKISF